MCGRYTLTVEVDDLLDAMPGLSASPEVRQALAPRYNVAPTQRVAAVPNDGRHAIELFQWGLVPSWADDPKIGSRMINARSETLAEKPSFRNAFRKRRCLVLADGFYEWKAVPGQKTKQPFHVRMKSRAPFALAGLWETWRPPEGEPLRSCTILTTSPNALMAGIHDRMPVILPAGEVERWLDPKDRQPAELADLLVPFAPELMEAVAVTTRVNSPAHDSPDCLAEA